MTKAADYANKLQGFAERVKAEPVQVPVQKVIPVQTMSESKEEQQLNVWITKDMMKRLKVKAIENDKTLKEMVTEAIEQFL